MKKIMAAVLAAATLVSAVSFSAFAADLAKDSGANPLKNGTFPMVIITEDMTDGKSDSVIPDGKALIQIPTRYSDKELYTVSAKAIEGAKYVKSISRVSKQAGFITGKFVAAVDPIWGNAALESGRADYIQVSLKPEYTSSEYKVRLEVTVKAKSKSGDTGTVKEDTNVFYVSNAESSNESWNAGTKGYVFTPTKNEENEVTWNDEIRDLARLTFIADSNVVNNFPKLNTKWNNEDYYEYFIDQDAFKFEFVSNPYISSTSRAVLEIYNPYYNVDTDEVTVAGEDVIIYKITDDGMVDVTEEFNYGENEDGDLVFTTKTRRLETYIFAEREIAMEDMVDDVPGTSTTPDKIPADTGR